MAAGRGARHAPQRKRLPPQRVGRGRRPRAVRAGAGALRHLRGKKTALHAPMCAPAGGGAVLSRMHSSAGSPPELRSDQHSRVDRCGPSAWAEDPGSIRTSRLLMPRNPEKTARLMPIWPGIPGFPEFRARKPGISRIFFCRRDYGGGGGFDASDEPIGPGGCANMAKSTQKVLSSIHRERPPSEGTKSKQGSFSAAPAATGTLPRLLKKRVWDRARGVRLGGCRGLARGSCQSHNGHSRQSLRRSLL